VPVIAPDAPGTPSGYAAHSVSYWGPLIEQAKSLVGVDYSTVAIENLMASESSGDPNAINNFDSNAAHGTPSKGLMQVIQPTFDANHVAGTSQNIYDPLANIAAALQYIKVTYGYVPNSPY
jgi:soluble lytic murein transglycosylase-like protein